MYTLTTDNIETVCQTEWFNYKFWENVNNIVFDQHEFNCIMTDIILQEEYTKPTYKFKLLQLGIHLQLDIDIEFVLGVVNHEFNSRKEQHKYIENLFQTNVLETTCWNIMQLCSKHVSSLFIENILFTLTDKFTFSDVLELGKKFSLNSKVYTCILSKYNNHIPSTDLISLVSSRSISLEYLVDQVHTMSTFLSKLEFFEQLANSKASDILISAVSIIYSKVVDSALLIPIISKYPYFVWKLAYKYNLELGFVDIIYLENVMSIDSNILIQEYTSFNKPLHIKCSVFFNISDKMQNLVYYIVPENTRKLIKLMKNKYNDICAICRCDLSASNVSVMFCNHIYHSKCIEEWINIHPSCPTCRTKHIDFV